MYNDRNQYEIDEPVLKAKKSNGLDVRIPDCPICKVRPKIKMYINKQLMRDVSATIDCCKQFQTNCSCGNEDYAAKQVVRHWVKKVDDWYRDKIVDNARKQITHRGLIYEYEIFLGVREPEAKVPEFGYDGNGSIVEGPK
jgi:hypothetical protein